MRQSLQREWGKPLKLNGPKENPLEIAVYKLQGADGKGHWFGRRSVHEGLPFSTWKSKLASEMDETLEANQVRIRKGRVADQAVRGIGAERLIERVTVKDEDRERVLGTVNVYHVSAQFPKPTTPRDFVTLIIHWETEVDGGSGATGAGAGDKAQRRGRNWMMVSKPCEHPDAPARQGYIRGQYESVEFIREIPVNRPPVQDVPLEKAVSPARSEDNLLRQGSVDPAGQKEGADGKVGRPRGKTESVVLEERDKETVTNIHDLDRDDEEDPWPVEWIMVTRSDPGGNIPRWMVEKGTPRSICTDAVKFVDWACRDPTAGDKDERDRHRRESSEKTVEISSLEGDAQVSTDSDDTEYEEEEHHGLIASFAYLLNAGLERYAPQAVLDYLPRHSRQSSAQYSSSEDTDGRSEKDAPSNVGAANAKGGTEGPEKDASTSTADAASQISQPVPVTNSVPTTPLSELAHENISPVDVIKMNKKGKLSSHEKQLAKLAQRKREVEAQLETIRNEIQTLQPRSSPEMDTKKARVAAATGDSGVSDQVSSSAASTELKGAVEGAASSNSSHHKHKTNFETAHMHKVASGLFQQEAKLLKQLGKIEKNQLKEASKIEAQQRKNADREEKTRSRSETDALRREVDTLKEEVERLRSERQKWLDLIASLQAENTRLVARQGGRGKDQSI
ncbi:hypothetical protein CDV55_100032 [Aspergillus turcosus]|nr:hypothetical protein CDV55_100032 [Aspergillus turcosus]